MRTCAGVRLVGRMKVGSSTGGASRENRRTDLNTHWPSSRVASRASIRSLKCFSVSKRNSVRPVSRTPCCSLRAALMMTEPSGLIWFSQKPDASYTPPPGAAPNSSASMRFDNSRRLADIGL